jgi:hypothetical protein
LILLPGIIQDRVDMKTAELSCWKCGASLADVLLPFSRLSKCKACNADLHVCRMCRFYDTTVNNSCREPVAEKVTDKKRANFCGYFQPSGDAYLSADGRNRPAAENELDELFGLNPGKQDNNNTGGTSLTPEEEAKRKLEDLFNLDRKS